MSVNHSAIFSVFFNIKVVCVFSLESPHRGDSNKYTQYTIFNSKKEIDLNYLKSAAMGFFPRDSSTSSNSHGKRATSVRVIEVLLYNMRIIENYLQNMVFSKWYLYICTCTLLANTKLELPF